tara:strand:- start:2575 stop:3006 length:432 start_codon:yes stop_codon:yes gene_type:complete
MKKTLLFASVCLPLWGCWGVAAWHGYKEPKIQVRETVKVVSPENVEAHVTLTKYQLDKMLSWYEKDAHPAETVRFKTVVKSDGDGWRISSTHLARGAEPYPIPEGRYFVIDSSYVDHTGDFKSCVEYAESYKSFHDYIVISAE